MADIFISYAHEDQEFVRRMVPILEAEGFSVWWDHTIPPGKSWDSFIAKGIADARCCVVVWSRHSIGSDWVKEEATLAKDAAKLLPVQIDAEPPMGFRRIQAANLQHWVGDTRDPQWQMLISEAHALVEASRTAGAPSTAAPRARYQPPPAYQSPDPARTASSGGSPAILFGIIGAVAAIAAAVFFFTREPAQPEEATAPVEATTTVTEPVETPTDPAAIELERLRQAEIERLRRENNNLQAQSREAQQYAAALEQQRAADRAAAEQRRLDAERAARSMVGYWDGDWGGWIGVWTFRSDGTFSHNSGEGVDEECRHGTYRLTGSSLRMEYTGCERSVVTGTLSGNTMTGSASGGQTVVFTRQ